MCGRITQQLSPDQVGELYGVQAALLPPDHPPRYNGAPGQDFSVCRVEEHGSRAIVRMRAGLIPSWARDARTACQLINARGESVHYKPPFRFERRAVSTCVNRVRNDDPDVLTAAPDSGLF